MWHDWVIEKRAGDIYTYSMLGGSGDEYTLYINEEFCGYLYNKSYVQTVCELIENSDDNKIIRLVTKNKPITEWQKWND